MSAPDADTIRLIYLNFKRGAGLQKEDVDALLRSQSVQLSKNALNELGRDSDRGRSIIAPQLLALMRAWADEHESNSER